MLHIRRTPKQQEIEEYRKWLEKHKTTPPTPEDRRKREQEFWKARGQALSRLTAPRTQGVTVVSPPPVVPRETPLGLEDPEREARAQQEIELKKLQVAPICNKGGLQYITNPEDFKTMGRKV